MESTSDSDRSVFQNSTYPKKKKTEKRTWQMRSNFCVRNMHSQLHSLSCRRLHADETEQKWQKKPERNGQVYYQSNSVYVLDALLFHKAVVRQKSISKTDRININNIFASKTSFVRKFEIQCSCYYYHYCHRCMGLYTFLSVFHC